MENDKNLFGVLKEMEASVINTAQKHNLDSDIVIWMLSNIIGGMATEGDIPLKYKKSTK